MLIKRLYNDGLAQASYLIGCQATGDAIVVDANREVSQYLELAAAEGLRITAVTETHIHADFVSGSRALVQATGAQLFLSGEGGADWQYAFAAADHATLVRDGDTISVGNIRLDVMHTPGHTPEHLAFVVTDTPAAAGPLGILTGDFLFVGDVGRPDLLEKAAHVAGTMEASARTLFWSVQRIRTLPDYLQVWPGHGAGSACGKALGAVPSSTLGYEKLANWAFRIADENAFVAEVLDGQPEPPLYFAEMKRINRDGPAVRSSQQHAPLIDVRAMSDALAAGATVVDTRPAAVFAAKHIPGTINIPLNKSFSTWAGWLVSYSAPFYLIADSNDETRIDSAVRELSLIGLDDVAGYALVSMLDDWASAGHPTRSTAQMTVQQAAAAESAGEVTVIDVRGSAEWSAAHVPGVVNIPVGELRARFAEIPKDRPIALHCQGGGRSAIGASVLKSLGVADVRNVAGGFSAWQQAGLPTVTESSIQGDVQSCAL